MSVDASTSATEEDGAETEGVDAAPAEKRSWFRTLGGWVGFFLLGFVGSALGAIGSCLLLARSVPPPAPVVSDDSQQAAVASEAPAVEEPAPELPVTAVLLERADAWLLAGNIDGACQLLQRAIAALGSDCPTTIQYRLAVCHEFLGDYERAIDEYRQLADLAVQPRLAIAARVGQARTRVRQGNRDLALAHLYPMLLDVHPLEEPDPTLAGEIAHLLAHVLAESALEGKLAPPIHEQGLARGRLENSPAQALRLLIPSDTQRQQTAPPLRPGITTLHELGVSPADISVELALARNSLKNLIDALAEHAGLQLVWSPATEGVLGHRTTQIHARDINMGVALDALLTPLGLTWSQTELTLKIEALHELDPATREITWKGLGERSLRHAVANFPDHYAAPVAYLSIGNLAFQQGETDRAATYFRQLVSQFPRSPTVVEAWFNYAKTQFANNDWQAASEAFYRSIDERRGGRLEPISHLYVGRILLDSNQADKSIRPLIRSVSSANTREVTGAAAVTLASAYLMSGSPHAANLVLREHRTYLESGAYRDVAAFLDALAHFRANRQSGRIEDKGRTLVTALTQVSAGGFFGQHGYWIVGNTYGDLGLPLGMTSLFREALEGPVQGELANRILFTLAEHELAEANLDEAERWTAELANSSNPTWATTARKLQADIAFERGELDTCLEICMGLLDESQDPTVTANTLRLMGRIYAHRQDHHNAALCYAGMRPQPSTKSSPAVSDP